jgi:GntR family transcriptional repressor for pyruvate dehydrogenase complex
MSFRSVSTTRSYEQVVEQLLERIHGGEFAPNQRLPTERELGELFGVSRGVIREAIKVLNSMGVVESRQGSGTYVSDNLAPSVSRALVLSAKPEEASLLSLMELRQSIEVLAARLAAERRSDDEIEEMKAAARHTITAAEEDNVHDFEDADVRFHRLVVEAARNPFLVTIHAAVRDIQRDVSSRVVMMAGAIPTAADQHVRIADAIAEHDAVTAATVMDEHLGVTIRALQGALALPPEERRHVRYLGNS